jgi:hypothetical protein
LGKTLMVNRFVNGDLHWETMAEGTRGAFDSMASLPIPDEFYLAGGTGLALQIGHRISYDLDFFSSRNSLGTLERTHLIRKLQQLEDAEIKHETDGQIYAAIHGVETSFLYQPHPLLFPPLNVHGVHLAQPADIGLMKLAAIKDRGTRRDFVDLYCLRTVIQLPPLFKHLPEKFFDRPDFSVHLAYALCYFDDAESDPQALNMVQETDWEAVKTYCLEGSRWLSKKNAGLEPS